MSEYMVINATKENACRTAEANAIREKSGQSGLIVYDFDGEKGFADAIAAIPTGGGDSAADGIIDRTISGTYSNANVSKIGAYAFHNCSSLTKAIFPACTSIGFSAFRSCSSLTEVSFPVCTSIGAYAFQYCFSLTKANFPACTSISNYIFYSCSSLTEANFPVCRNIGSYTFYDCRSLTKANFPACTSIGSYTFYSCRSLTEVSFPVCTSIDAYAFQRCVKLLSLYLLGSSVPRLGNINVFASTPISNYTTSTGGVYGSIIVPQSMLSAYKASTNWSLYSSRFSAWNGVD